MKDDFFWTFQTIRPCLLRHFPLHEQKLLRPETEVLLVFNQPIQKAISFFSLKKIGKNNIEIPVEFSIKAPSEEILKENRIDSSPENTLLLKPKETLEPDSKYRVEIEEGLPGKQGTLGMEKPFTFFFETYGTFQFISFGADENHNPYDSLKFTFSNPVSYREFIQKIRLEPVTIIPDYYSEWDHAESTLWINLPFQPETQYRLWIDSELQDIFKNKLTKEIPLEFKTAPFPASVSMNTGHRIVEATSDLRFPVYILNNQEISVEAARIKKEDILPLLNKEKIFWSSEKLAEENFFSFQERIKQIFP
jgi:hypothetical protein